MASQLRIFISYNEQQAKSEEQLVAGQLIIYISYNEQQAKSEEQLVDVPATVINLRKDRMNMVSPESDTN